MDRAGLFTPRQRENTIAQLYQAWGHRTEDIRAQQTQWLASAEARIRRFQAAITAGVDPLPVADAIIEAQTQRAAAQVELESAAPKSELQHDDIESLVETLGDMAAVLNRADPEHQASLYQELQLHLRYDHPSRSLAVSVTPRVDSARVRGGT